MKNLNRLGGLIYSQRVLLALTQNGMDREEAYSLVQRNAMEVWDIEEDKRPGAFYRLLENDPSITKTLEKKTLKELFEINHYTKHVDLIFSRVFKE